ncbi:MAG TPA: hypothetical protein VK911_11140 [Vicinamibacterales bacterium]|nr:hypothetical protein [Vicinamibacterales bacterium]
MDAAPRSLATLLEGLVDYAGLFPPAALDMNAAAARYRRARAGPHAAALARFVVPAARLDELALAGGDLPPGGEERWPLSALVSSPIGADVERIAAFNARHAGDTGWTPHVEAIEAKAASAGELQHARRALPGCEVFVEVPLDGNTGRTLDTLAASGCRAKVRTGGTTVDAFPPVELLAGFLAGCASRRLPFKATAGLHHPVRGRHPVSYDAGAPRAAMHGFLNVFVAAALLIGARIDEGAAAAVLREADPAAFLFEEERAGWKDRTITIGELAEARRLALGFGSCSFDEPMDDLAALGLIAAAPAP